MKLSKQKKERYKASIALIKKTFGNNKNHDEWLKNLIDECEAARAYDWQNESRFEPVNNDGQNIPSWRRAAKTKEVKAVQKAALKIADFLEATPVENGPTVFDALKKAECRLISDSDQEHQKTMADWAASPTMRAEYDGKFDIFLAYRKAVADGRVRVAPGRDTAFDELDRKIESEIKAAEVEYNTAMMLAATLRKLADGGFWELNPLSRYRYIFGPLEYSEPVDIRKQRPEKLSAHLYYMINLLNDLPNDPHYEIARQLAKDTFKLDITEDIQGIGRRYIKYKAENPHLAFIGYDRPVKFPSVYTEKFLETHEFVPPQSPPHLDPEDSYLPDPKAEWGWRLKSNPES